MKFSSKKDIEVPVGQLWGMMTDFEAWERSAMRRGAEVERTDTLRNPAVGMSWRAKAVYRGKPRVVDIKLTEMTVGAALGFDAVSATLQGTARVELIEMSAKRTRLHVSVEVTPLSLGARLFLQSLRLARARVDRKFDNRIAQMAADLEHRARLGPRKV